MTPSVQHVTLDGSWTFRNAAENQWYPAEVPGCVHTDLMRNSLIPDPFFGTNEENVQWVGEKDWEYQSRFDLPAGLLEREHIDIVFMGLDTYATVTMNGTIILKADNMFREWRVDCKSVLRPRGNTLTIRFTNVFDTNLPRYRNAPFPLQAFGNNDQADVKIAMYSRKAQFHYGWDWGPRLITCGVWRPVKIEGWDSFRIQGVHIRQESITSERAILSPVVEVFAARKQKIRIRIATESTVICDVERVLQQGENAIALRGELQNPTLWWSNGLGDHHLYPFTTQLSSAAGEADERNVHVGLRSLEVVRDKDSLGTSLYVRLNGVPVFMKGANYIPQDNFQSRVSSDRYEHIVQSAVAANMNMLRVWGGGIYEDDLFYDLCDRNGILVWHDMMFACAMYPADAGFLQNVAAEIKDNIRRLRNHPCIALYCGNNENEVAWYQWNWKPTYSSAVQRTYEEDMRKLFHDVIPSAIREVDPTRYYHNTSPNTGYNGISPMEGDMHYWGVWHGKEPFETYEKNIARFVSEYGFQSYPELHTVVKFAGPADREIHSPVMLSHQRCMADERRDKEYGNRLIQTYLDRYYKPPKDFETYLYVSQVLQADGVAQAIEAHRRAMPTCMGSLFWQIDDCWPVASWSSIDYFGRWKALHYKARSAFAPVIVSPVVDSDSVRFYIVSDELKQFVADLEITVQEFNGREVFRQVQRVTVAPNTSGVHVRLARNDLAAKKNQNRVALISQLVAEGTVVAQSVRYLVPPKDLDLQSVSITHTVKRVPEGFAIELHSDTLAKSVYLSSAEGEGSFTDNYFDLLPNVRKTVVFQTKEKIADWGSKLKIVSLVDSF